MAALDWITVEGFKSIKRIERLALEPINIVIGSNGSGKSNLIGVFSFLREIRCGRLREYVIRAGGADKILHFGSRMTPALMMRISFGGEINQYEISLTTTSGDELSPLGEAVYFRDKNRYEQPYGEVLVARSSGEAAISTTTSRITRYVREHFDSWRVYHFRDTSSTSPIKKTADVDDNRFLRHDGGNLAAFLYFLRQKHEDSYDLIRRTVRLVAPFTGRVVTTMVDYYGLPRTGPRAWPGRAAVRALLRSPRFIPAQPEAFPDGERSRRVPAAH